MTSKNIDREMKLLQETVDEAGKKYSLKLTPKTYKIIKTVEDFISKNELICYGGMAINNILPKKAQFYKPNEFPDFDFFSSDALNDAKKLADIYFKQGYGNVEAKSGFHLGTYKVYVNFFNIADVTQLDDVFYTNLKKKAIKKGKLLYAPPDFLRMSMYLELSRPKGETSRWEKVLPRLQLLNRHYPMKTKRCKKSKEKLNSLQLNIYNTLKTLLIKEKVIFFGGFADKLYSKYTKNKRQTSELMTLEVLSTDAKKVSERLKDKLKEFDVKINHLDKIGGLIPEQYTITIEDKLYAHVYQTEACYTYNKIKVDNKIVNIATIFTMMSLYLIFIYNDNNDDIKNRILCTATMLNNIYLRNRTSKKGILRNYTVKCIGEQETFEDILLEKKKAFKEIKKSDTKYEKYFLRYNPK